MKVRFRLYPTRGYYVAILLCFLQHNCSLHECNAFIQLHARMIDLAFNALLCSNSIISLCIVSFKYV